MKLLLTILYSVAIGYNLLYLAYNVQRTSMFNLLWSVVIIIACSINLYFLWKNKQQSE
ncbi:hypothetical protein JNG37_03995 [Streptococcus suis]|nr:hypothetical protein [Streptococcus suis]MBM7270054.1 hypothetical protein [Streptococcus suis]